MKIKFAVFLLILLGIGGSTFAQNNARMLSTPNAQTGTSYTFVAADTTRVVTFSNAGAVAASLPNGATFGFGAGTMLSVVNLGAGAVTITCASCTINGAATLVLSQNQGADLYGGIGGSGVNYVALASPAGANIAVLNAPNAFTNNNTHSGAETFLNLNDILWVGPGSGSYTTIAAAVTAAGSTNPAIIGIRSTYAGTECPAVQNNLVFWDFRAGGRTGSGTSSFICSQNTVQYNTKTPGFTDAMLRMELTRTAVDASGSILPLYAIAHLKNATVTGGVVEGVGPECDIDGTLSGTLDFCIGFEGAAFYNVATGGTVTNMAGGMGYAQSSVGSTTATINAIGLWGRGAVSPFPTAPTNAYGVMCDAQTFGSARNYCYYAKGISLAGFSSGVGGWDFEDASNVAHRAVYVAADNSMNLQAINAIGVNIADSGASTRLNVSSSGVKITAVNNGQGIQAFNSATTCTTGAAVGGTCTTAAITLPVGYSDTNYRLVCTGLTPTNVPIVQTVAKSNTTFTITIAALTAAAATFTSYDCSAVHN